MASTGASRAMDGNIDVKVTLRARSASVSSVVSLFNFGIAAYQ